MDYVHTRTFSWCLESSTPRQLFGNLFEPLIEALWYKISRQKIVNTLVPRQSFSDDAILFENSRKKLWKKVRNNTCWLTTVLWWPCWKTWWDAPPGGWRRVHESDGVVVTAASHRPVFYARHIGQRAFRVARVSLGAACWLPHAFSAPRRFGRPRNFPRSEKDAPKKK